MVAAIALEIAKLYAYERHRSLSQCDLTDTRAGFGLHQVHGRDGAREKRYARVVTLVSLLQQL